MAAVFAGDRRGGGGAGGLHISGVAGGLRSLAGYLRLPLVFVWDTVLRERFNFSFSKVFC